MSKPAAQRYAKALYSIAEEKKTINPIFEDMQLVVSTFAANKVLRVALHSPVITVEQKLNVAKEVFKKLQKDSLQLIEVLSANGRIKLLAEVAKAFVEHYEEAHHIQHADITTAVELDAKLEKEIQNKIIELTGTKADLNLKVNPDLLGGFILRIKDMQFDASVANRLQQVKRELVN